MAKFTGSSGIEWDYTLEGENSDVLLFIHGWGIDKRIWRQQTKYFADDFKVLSLDLPGHGESTWQEANLADMAKDIFQFLEKNNITQITTVGSSLGGLLTLKLYETNANAFKRMILVGSMPKFSKSDDYPYGLDVTKMRKLHTQLDTDYPSIVNVFFRSLFTKEERASRRFKWLQKFRQTDSVPMQPALVEYLDILEHEDLRHVFPAIDVPTQIITGRQDDICSLETVAYLQEIKPDAQYDFFDKCGHFPFLSKPHEFNDILEKFLNKTK